MGDFDRDQGRDREHIRETDRTTIVTGDGGRRGGSGWILAVVLLIALLAILFFMFGGGLNRAGDETDINLNVSAPNVEVPDNIKLDVPEKIEVPDEIKVETNSQ